MRFKIYFTVLLIVGFSINIFAKKIDKSTAERVALHFYYAQSNLYDEPVNLSDLDIVNEYKVGQAYFVFNLDHGWVIVSADDALWPVLGYNFEGSFPANGDLDYNLRNWLQTFVDEADYVAANNIKPSALISGEWAKYNKPDDDFFISPGSERSEVEPLLISLWNQDFPYNILCPEDEAGPGGHVYAGCVATAMAQIMYYWRYPNQGSGQYSYYQYPYGTISADFGNTTYVWDGMQNSIDPGNPWEVALISFHAGVSVQMNYGPDGSGAYSQDVPYALKNYFTYSNSAQYLSKSNFSASAWESMLQADLDNSMPIYYSGYSTSGGHAFVCDGYQGTNYYHFNFGWSGSANGYYTLQDVDGFNSYQAMVRNIYPGDGDYPYIADGADTLSESSGSLTDGSGPEDYPAGMNASWLINPQTEEDSISSIRLNFAKFNTASTDTLSVYGGNSTEEDDLLGKFAGSDLPQEISYDGNQMLITFSSTGSAEGFFIEYNTSSPTWCSSSQTFSEPSGTFDDGSGSFFYSNNTTCMYKITNPEAVKITLEFTEFSTEENNDVVQVYNGETQELIGQYSGHSLPDVISAETGTLIILWATNSTVRDEGWAAEYFIDGVGIQENSFTDFSVYPNPSSGMLNISIDELPAGDSYLQVVSMNGQIIYNEKLATRARNVNKTIDLTNESKGVYLISLITSKDKIDRKIVLK
ncbi:MAG: T9SS type A sorting domain-containing protein [Chlorobi bacterium]|nr:T9SS type A sorting domain-containing protein [Chlorobiota bacterium]